MKPLLAIDNLTRRFGTFRAVDAVSFELGAGEVLGFLGPNGAGKSTTMRMISGALAPSGGSIEINGIDLRHDPVAAKALLGYLPENPPLYPELSVNEYLRHAGELRRIPRVELAGAVESVKSLCGLADSGERLIGNLSKGYQQRVGIAQAIIHNPSVVILDEPTNGLDPIQIQEIRELIRALRKTRGIILSTHILAEVRAVCTRVQIINQGRLVYSADMEQFGGEQRERLILVLQSPPQVETLSGLEGVHTAETIDTGSFRLHLTPGTRASDIAGQAVSQGWGLEEMYWEREDLERIFTRLTTSDEMESA